MNNEKKWLDGIDVIYWINLERSVDRKNYMKKIFEDSIFDGIPIHRIEASDWQKEDVISNFEMNKQKGSIKEHIISNFVTNKPTRNVKEYSCLLSHLNAINEFTKSNYQNALILEDDISLEYKKYWTKTAKEIMEKVPDKWDIIQLHYLAEINLYKKIKGDFKKRPKDKFWSCASYIIKKASADKFMKSICKNNKYILDDKSLHVSDAFIYDKMRTYTYIPPFLAVHTTKNKKSTIQPSLKYQLKTKKNMDDFFKRKYTIKKCAKV